MGHPHFYLIPNAHLGPVWLLDRREGLTEALVTTRTLLDLMDEFEELTLGRGESDLDRPIEEIDPKTLCRIARYVEAGRWAL